MLPYLCGLRSGLLHSAWGSGGVYAHEHAQDPVFPGVLESPTGTRGRLLIRIDPPKALSWPVPLPPPRLLGKKKGLPHAVSRWPSLYEHRWPNLAERYRASALHQIPAYLHRLALVSAMPEHSAGSVSPVTVLRIHLLVSRPRNMRLTSQAHWASRLTVSFPP